MKPVMLKTAHSLPPNLPASLHKTKVKAVAILPSSGPRPRSIQTAVSDQAAAADPREAERCTAAAETLDLAEYKL